MRSCIPVPSQSKGRLTGRVTISRAAVNGVASARPTPPADMDETGLVVVIVVLMVTGSGVSKR